MNTRRAIDTTQPLAIVATVMLAAWIGLYVALAIFG